MIHGSFGAAGHPVLVTPNLDRLAGEGVRFTNAFVTTSLCSPSRASLLTGRYARSHGVMDNGTPLSAELDSYASVLAGAGYQTAYFGKWHMGDQSERPGFARSVSYDKQGTYLDCRLRIDGEPARAKGHVDDRVTDFALEFLAEERDAPFLLCLGFKGAHAPLMPAPRFDGLYTEAAAPEPLNADALPPFPLPSEWADLAGKLPISRYEPPADWVRQASPQNPKARAVLERWRRYCRTLSQIDENVGRVLDALDELELADDTAVAYVSDNGFIYGQHGMGVGKRVAYEESIRIDFLLRAPGAAPAGAVVDGIALNIDLAPTILDWAGLQPAPGMQGRSLLPLARGEATDWRCDFLYEYTREPRFPVPTIETLYSACEEDSTWKLTRYPGYPAWTELYEVGSDPNEVHNLWLGLWLGLRDGPVAQRLFERLDQLTAEL